MSTPVTKFKTHHFKFQRKDRVVKAKSWAEYYLVKAKEKKGDFDKFFLKKFREQLKTNQFKMLVTHLPSNTKCEFIVEKLNREELMAKTIEHVQLDRKKRVIMASETREFDGAKYKRIGGVMEKPKLINALGQSLTTNDPLKNKKPRASNKNYIGIELEFMANLPGHNTKTIGQVFKLAGLSKYVCVTTDASCGFEVRVLLQEDEFETILTKIMSIIKGLGFTVDKTCGTHVHLDMRNRNVAQVYKNMFMTQGFLRKFLAKHRKNNRFCQPNKKDNFDEQHALNDRRHAINVEAYQTHRTLEIRMHQGTLDANELIPWIKMLIKISNFKESVVKNVNTLRQAKTAYQLEPELAEKLEGRIRTLFGQVVETIGRI